MNFGIVVCSRVKSSRIACKPLQRVNGENLITHLLMRLIPTKFPVVLATTIEDKEFYPASTGNYSLFGSGFEDDPLARTVFTAEAFGFDAVVRVTHDKIFVNANDITDAINTFKLKGADYLYCVGPAPGTGFEIIKTSLLKTANEAHKNVEHISYAVRKYAEKQIFFPVVSAQNYPRLLIDYPEDLKLIEVILATLGNYCTQAQVLAFLTNNPHLLKINNLPKVSIYTCAYNAEKTIAATMNSIATQEGFNDFEYTIVDDFSSDRTLHAIAEFAITRPNVRWVRNQKNIGLASSSNVALSLSKGEYIIRLDADDFFPRPDAIKRIMAHAEKTRAEIVYPSNYFGSFERTQPGHDGHHVGGALFQRRALEHLKFTEGLRGWEGYDIFERAKSQLHIEYLEDPIFFYTQRADSMSKTNLDERLKIKSLLKDQHEKSRRH